MKKETKYNKVVNIAEDGEISVLNYTFEHSKDFRGATGNRFYPITENEIQERIGDYEDNDMEFLKYWADNIGDITSQMIDNIDTSREALIEFFFDSSYSELWDYMREELGKTDATKEDYPVIFDCVGGGRMFDADFQGNVNPELSKIIREFES